MTKDLVGFAIFAALIAFQLKVGVAYIGVNNRVTRKNYPKVYFAILSIYAAFAIWAAFDLMIKLTAP